MTSWKIFFQGQVQGVGFRLTMARKAKELDLVGYVKNNPDGQVESIVAGPREKLSKLISYLQENFAISDIFISATKKYKAKEFVIK